MKINFRICGARIWPELQLKFGGRCTSRTLICCALICIFTNWGIGFAAGEDLTQCVNSWMGILGKGNVAPGPQLPWGSVNPGPDTADGYTSGYNPTRKISGFSQLHVTGTGGPGKYGQFLISPQIGLQIGESTHESLKTEETASPSYYRVRLTRYNILSELTATRHAVIYRFTFPESTDGHLLLDLGHNIPKDSNLFSGGYADEAEVILDVKTKSIQGWGNYWGGWSAEPFRVYFAAQYDRHAIAHGTWINGVVHPENASESITQKKQRIGAYLQFKTTNSEPVLLKIAISFKSTQQAQQYLAEEIPDWDFNQVRSAADSAWEHELNKIRIEGASPEQKSIFYTSLYNSMRMPHDRTGDNRKWQSEEPYWDDHYCVWDTWRTLFPLQILINEKMVRDNLKAFCDRFKFNGQVEDAFIAGNDRYYEWHGDDRESWLGNQGGDDVDNIIADAYVKGVSGVDWNACYQILKSHADGGRAPAYRATGRGWVPYHNYPFGLFCSRSLEFSYNDFCVAQVAGGLGKESDRITYLQRSREWEKLWNPSLESDGFKGFISPRTTDGSFVAYDPKSDRALVGSGGDLDRAFYEGSSWVYSYFVPHDFARLIALSGGDVPYCKKLQHALESGNHDVIQIVDGRKVQISKDSGLIDFGNEPSFMTPFSFIYAKRPDLACFWVRKNMANYTQNGFPGDEDSGAMGSWMVFAAMGFFPNAGQDIYLLNGPLFKKITVTRENGKVITIEGIHASSDNIYIQSVELNGKPINRPWVKHGEVKDGATLRFVMGSKPSGWATGLIPPSVSTASFLSR